MNTWVDTSYSVVARTCLILLKHLGSSIFLDYISIRIDETSGLPYISKKYKRYRFFSNFLTHSNWKEIEAIQEGDIVFCINGITITQITI